MWLNFKSDNRNQSHGGNGRLLPNSTQGEGSTKKLAARQFSRQNSSRSSTRSAKSSILKKLDEHEMKTKTTEWQKNQDYQMIRERRKILRKQIGAKLRAVRRLYVPSILGVCLGIVFIFGATIRTLSDGTIFWTQREQFKIIGPILLIVGIILLLTAVGLETHSREKLKKAGIEEVKPFIHPDFLKEPERVKRQISKDSSTSSYDPTCSGLDRQRLLWKNRNQGCDDVFLCSSIASTSSATTQGNTRKTDFADRWAKAMAINLHSCPVNLNEHAEAPFNDTVDDYVDNSNNNSQASLHLRALHNAPVIEVTNTDEISSLASLSSAVDSGSIPMSSGEASTKTSESKYDTNGNSFKENIAEQTNRHIIPADIWVLRGISQN
ncbi:uncharacterized protein LOC123564300 [Mercenaria mercenaria]|uniref:uncharacterized protein LOC123564300 n=1 Tax=Mercenaria mercenaria TaxID=6596 RepID=UPI00234E88F2|nr:uncharacterized protein LOC123564300 [Mercenaria mercenaria]XP_045213713.2 uncharacterized protein LOC123564300 [Mercenaria mercenaria]XP_045213715.2 uncharacterized protein LOC123564300 [Mercenaria mercenaria]XP_053392907.1 uncharacterized protein LOC123564300 [Mercenaria mercenaria]XP_053392908.1 uncharacterized protein LOC123564300 [Mercenaria mercenaria]